MATVPLRFANTRGIPMLEVQSVTNTTTLATFNFNDHPQRGSNFFGGFWVKMPSTAGLTGTAKVEFATLGVLGSNLPVYLYNGNQATALDLSTLGGILLCFYDRTTNRLQVIGLPPAATT